MPRESEKRYRRLLLVEVRDGVWDLDVRPGELYWNDCLFEMLGLSRSQFTPTFKGFSESVHLEDRQQSIASPTALVARRESDAIEYNVALRTEFRVRGSTGEQDRALIRIMGLMIDVTGCTLVKGL